jgi:transposase
MPRSNYLLALFGLLKERPPGVMTGFRSQDSRRTFVAQGSGLRRGDRNRNRKIAALRGVVRPDRAVLAVDLGEDKQVAVVMDHEGRVLARRTVTVKAHQLAGLLGWGAERAARAGFAGLTVACEPTGHRWKALMGLADAAGHGFCCVQSLAVHRAREGDDYTLGKTDHRDSYLIGKLVIRLECYLPERAEEAWARLRHLGARRFALVAEVVSGRQQIGDLLGCAWPAALAAAARPLESTTWLAAMGVVTDRCCGNPARLRKMGYDRFLAAVRRELPRWGACRVYHAIARGLWDALADPGGVAAQRRGVLERVHLLLADWRSLLARLADVEARMCAVLDELGLTGLVTSIDGLSAVGAAVILAETGDLSRFASGRAVVKHAGLNPAENTSATLAGRTRISRRGRPGLRTAAWRASWAGLRHNQVLRARYAHLTGRDSGPRLADGQARAACAAALLRWLYAVITRRQAWDPRIAAGTIAAGVVTAPAAA